MQTKEERKAAAKARCDRYIAEHRCVGCGRQDARTLSGLRYCKKCSDRRVARDRAKKETEGTHRTPKEGSIAYALGRCPYMHGGELSCLDCLRPTCRKCAAKMRIAQREAYRSKGKCEYAEGLEDLGEYACLHCPRPGKCKYEEDDDGD